MVSYSASALSSELDTSMKQIKPAGIDVQVLLVVGILDISKGLYDAISKIKRAYSASSR